MLTKQEAIETSDLSDLFQDQDRLFNAAEADVRSVLESDRLESSERSGHLFVDLSDVEPGPRQEIVKSMARFFKDKRSLKVPSARYTYERNSDFKRVKRLVGYELTDFTLDIGYEERNGRVYEIPTNIAFAASKKNSSKGIADLMKAGAEKAKLSAGANV